MVWHSALLFIGIVLSSSITTNFQRFGF